jgi:hypothetical protein
MKARSNRDYVAFIQTWGLRLYWPLVPWAQNNITKMCVPTIDSNPWAVPHRWFTSTSGTGCTQQVKLSVDTRIDYLLARVRHAYCGRILEFFLLPKNPHGWSLKTNAWDLFEGEQTTNKQKRTKKKVRYNLGQPHGPVSMAPDFPGAPGTRCQNSNKLFCVFLPFRTNQDKLICRIIWCVKQMGNMQLDSNTTFFNSLRYLICRSTTQLWVLGSCSSLVWIHVQSEPTSMHLQHLQRCSVYDPAA